MASAGQNTQCRPGLAVKRVLQNLRQSCLPLGHPAGVVLTHSLLVIAEQVGNICDGNTPLQENARECVPEAVRCGGLFKNNPEPPIVIVRLEPDLGYRIYPSQ